MISPRTAARGAIPLFVAATLLLVSLCGPLRRSHLTPARAVTVDSTAAFYDLCRSDGVRGRRAVVFARDLIPAENPFGDSPEVHPLTDLMHHGMVRELFHVVPDRAWPEVTWNLANVSIYRSTSTGRVAAFEDGRVNVDRLSSFWPGDEVALLLVDPAAWTPPERQTLVNLVRAGRLRADLVALLRASPQELATWTAALSSAPR